MTTPDDAATPETTRPTDQQTTRTTDQQTTDDTSPPGIPGRTPITEEAGAPIVPTTTERAATTTDPTRRSLRRPSPPVTDAERDAPLVPDLRPTRRTRTDGGSR